MLIVVSGVLKVVAHLHDAATWKNLRARAAEVKLGMTQDEVLEVMGKPDRRASPDRFQKETWDEWWYQARRLFSRNREIRIQFDPKKVDEVEELPYEQIPFDSEDWKRSSALRRGFMIDDLLDRHDLRGSTREALIELLGEPPDSYYDYVGDLVWCLGPQRGGFAVDNDWLVIDLDEDGSVKTVCIIPD